MTIDDFKDLVDISNVSRQFIDRIKKGIDAEEELEDDFILRFALMFTFDCGAAETLPPDVEIALQTAMMMAIADPAIVEDELFRGGE